MVRHLIIRMKNGRAARPKHVVSEMTKVAGKAGIEGTWKESEGREEREGQS